MKHIKRERRKKRVGGRVSGTSERPRLSVYRSNRKMYAQVIDDTKAVTIVASSGLSADEVGAEIAKKATAKKLTAIVFDRSGYRYHGKVKALAEAARKGGLNF